MYQLVSAQRLPTLLTLCKFCSVANLEFKFFAWIQFLSRQAEKSKFLEDLLLENVFITFQVFFAMFSAKGD